MLTFLTVYDHSTLTLKTHSAPGQLSLTILRFHKSYLYNQAPLLLLNTFYNQDRESHCTFKDTISDFSKVMIQKIEICVLWIDKTLTADIKKQLTLCLTKTFYSLRPIQDRLIWNWSISNRYIQDRSLPDRTSIPYRTIPDWPCCHKFLPDWTISDWSIPDWSLSDKLISNR